MKEGRQPRASRFRLRLILALLASTAVGVAGIAGYRSAVHGAVPTLEEPTAAEVAAVQPILTETTNELLAQYHAVQNSVVRISQEFTVPAKEAWTGVGLKEKVDRLFIIGPAACEECLTFVGKLRKERLLEKLPTAYILVGKFPKKWPQLGPNITVYNYTTPEENSFPITLEASKEFGVALPPSVMLINAKNKVVFQTEGVGFSNNLKLWDLLNGGDMAHLKPDHQAYGQIARVPLNQAYTSTLTEMVSKKGYSIVIYGSADCSFCKTLPNVLSRLSASVKANLIYIDPVLGESIDSNGQFLRIKDSGQHIQRAWGNMRWPSASIILDGNLVGNIDYAQLEIDGKKYTQPFEESLKRAVKQ